MKFGLYIHVPYCLQKCHYCDFSTARLDHSVSMSAYTQLLLNELRLRAKFIPYKKITSIYFGGGTPSLLPAEDILTICREVANLGFEINPDAEISIEINPGTISREKLDLYLAAKINRFSVGVQTFNDGFLKASGREHSSDDSRKTLEFLIQHKLNYSFDLLFGLPKQSQKDLQADLDELVMYAPPHVSIYNLTVPDAHPMNQMRVDDEVQATMFTQIEGALEQANIRRYELSNFSQPEKESQHNQIYWSGQPYWGIGVSAHSYLPNAGPWGTRFWNSPSLNLYAQHIQNELSANLAMGAHSPFYEKLPKNQREPLNNHEAITDHCHTHLRMMRGLTLNSLKERFNSKQVALVTNRAENLVSQGLLIKANDSTYRLSPKGMPLANQVFLALTFLENEI